ncbi:MAG: hypothetical protein ACOCXT_03380 [Candidatus Dojkabacteria bacterium]
MSDNQNKQTSKQNGRKDTNFTANPRQQSSRSFLRQALSNESGQSLETSSGSPALNTTRERYRRPGSQALDDGNSTENEQDRSSTDQSDLPKRDVSFEENKQKYDHLELKKADETGVLDYFVGGGKNQRVVERLFDPNQKEVVADSQRAPDVVQKYKDYHIEKAIKEYIEVERENAPEQIMDIEERTQEIIEEEYGIPDKPIDTVASRSLSEKQKEKVQGSEKSNGKKSTDVLTKITQQTEKLYEEKISETIKAQNTQKVPQSPSAQKKDPVHAQDNSNQRSDLDVQEGAVDGERAERAERIKKARENLKQKLRELGSHSSYVSSGGSGSSDNNSSQKQPRKSQNNFDSSSPRQQQQSPQSDTQSSISSVGESQGVEQQEFPHQEQQQQEQEQEKGLKDKLDEAKKAKEAVEEMKKTQQGAKAARGAQAAGNAKKAQTAQAGLRGLAALFSSPIGWVIIVIIIILILLCIVIAIIIVIIASANPTITKENLQSQGKGLVTFMGVGEVDAEPFRRENLRSGLDDAVLVEKDSAGNVNAVTFQTGYRLNKNYREDVIDLPLDEMKLQIQVLEGIPATTDFTIDFEYGGDGAAISQAGKGMLWTLVCRNNGCDEDTSVVTISFQEPVAPEEIGQIFRVTYDMQANFNIGGAIRDQVKSDLPTRELCINIVSGEQVYCSGFSNPFFGEDYADNAGQEISGGEVVNNGDIVDGYMCPFVTSFESGEGRLVCTQGRHGAYGAVDVAYTGASRWYDQTEVLSPVDGRVIYAEHAGNVPLCGDALLIVDDTTGIQYYIGHIALNAQMNQNVNNSSIRGGRGTGFTVKQGEKLGTVFMTDEFDPNYGNNFVEGGMAGQLCWLGAHLHMDKRNDEAGTTVFDNIEKSCKLQGKVTNADRCR